MRTGRTNSQGSGLDWRQALARYAPRIVVCQRCHTHCSTGVERAERLCAFHLSACGLGAQMEATRYQLVTLLARQVITLQTPTPAADTRPRDPREIPSAS